MPGIAVIGAQWGDEGKGKIVDALAHDADVVVRYSGGANAGHTVVAGGETFKLHHLPCGVLHERPTSVLGAGMVIDPWTFLQELDALAERRDPGRIVIAREAHLVLPHHRKNDEGGGFVGTTGRGIGPAYSDKARRLGLRFGDLIDDAVLRDSLGRLLEGKPNSTARVGWTDVEVAMDALADIRAYVAPMVTDTGEVVRAALRAGQRVLFEGGQGTMLDLGYGTYPFVTSSHPTVGGILVGAGVSHKALHGVIGVVKAFTTRVGHGPFRTEVAGEKVDGVELTRRIRRLERGAQLPIILLTAHAMTPDNLIRSIQRGAAAYVPKDKMVEIEDYLVDMIKSKQAGHKKDAAWFKRLKPFFDRKFGEGWREKDREFWRDFDKTHLVYRDELNRLL